MFCFLEELVGRVLRFSSFGTIPISGVWFLLDGTDTAILVNFAGSCILCNKPFLERSWKLKSKVWQSKQVGFKLVSLEW